MSEQAPNKCSTQGLRFDLAAGIPATCQVASVVLAFCIWQIQCTWLGWAPHLHAVSSPHIRSRPRQLMKRQTCLQLCGETTMNSFVESSLTALDFCAWAIPFMRARSL